MAQVTIKTIEQNDNVGMFSICFKGDSESEFEKFLLELKDNATYNKDFNAILLALSKIIDKGALERFFRIEGRKSNHVSALIHRFAQTSSLLLEDIRPNSYFGQRWCETFTHIPRR